MAGWPPGKITPALLASKKRYGWCRLYDDFTGHKKWRVIAEKIRRTLPDTFTVTRDSVTVDFALVTVHAIVGALFNAASKVRDRGNVGNIDFDEIAAALNLSAEIVATAYRTLGEHGWIEDDHIVDWLDRQPDHEDPTAAERQRNRRARLRAKRARAMGVEPPPAAQRGPQDVPRRPHAGGIPPLALVAPRDSTEEATVAAEHENEQIALIWLFGSDGMEMGPASAIVSQKLGQMRLSADQSLRGWYATIGYKAFPLARIIEGSRYHAATGEAWRRIVIQQVEQLARIAEFGPALPLAPTVIGGRNAG